MEWTALTLEPDNSEAQLTLKHAEDAMQSVVVAKENAAAEAKSKADGQAALMARMMALNSQMMGTPPQPPAAE